MDIKSPRADIMRIPPGEMFFLEKRQFLAIQPAGLILFTWLNNMHGKRGL
jgi:hypothetical protein